MTTRNRSWADAQEAAQARGERPLRRPPARPAIESPCRPVEGWIRKAVQAAQVIASPTLPPEVSLPLLAVCKTHVGDCCSIGKDGRHYCRCCGCGEWHAGSVGSSLEYKTTKAAHECPRGLHAEPRQATPEEAPCR